MKFCPLVLVTALLMPAAEWKPLFDGKDLDGWKMVGPGRFLVEDGMLKTEGGMGLLYHPGETFGNCTIRVVFKTASERASGVFIRLPEEPKDPWFGVHNGYEVQIDAAGDEWHSTGALYSLSKVSATNQKPAGEWNTMDIVLEGQDHGHSEREESQRIPRWSASAGAGKRWLNLFVVHALTRDTSACKPRCPFVSLFPGSECQEG